MNTKHCVVVIDEDQRILSASIDEYCGKGQKLKFTVGDMLSDGWQIKQMSACATSSEHSRYYRCFIVLEKDNGSYR